MRQHFEKYALGANRELQKILCQVHLDRKPDMLSTHPIAHMGWEGQANTHADMSSGMSTDIGHTISNSNFVSSRLFSKYNRSTSGQ